VYLSFFKKIQTWEYTLLFIEQEAKAL